MKYISIQNYFSSFLHISIAFFLFFVIMAEKLHSSAAQVRSNYTDHSALMSLKAGITSDPLQSLASWNESIHFCQWFGVICGRKHHRVVEINLSSLKLTGTLSPFVGNLSFLRVFTIDNNNFTGELLPEISQLSQLRVLSLVNNSFSGKIPSNISQCLNLESILFGWNNLVGSIPIQFESLSKLKHFEVNSNDLTGRVPDFLGNNSAIEDISLSNNHFEGNIPNTLGGLAALKKLYLGVNNFSGPIPSSIFNLSNLVALELLVNKMEGSLPSDLWLVLPKLRRFLVGDNRFTGSIPKSLSNASQLDLLQLDMNGFTGEVPDMNGLQKLASISISVNNFGNGGDGDLNFISSLINNTNLDSLAFYINNLGGTFPRSIGNLSQLTFLGSFNNPIYGNIPIELGELVKLETLGMGGSKFTGGIPSSIGNLQELRQLSFNENNLSGKIPPSLGNLSKLSELYLGNNNFEGSIPPSFANLTQLTGLRLSQNNLSGLISSEIFSLPSLIYLLDLSNNHFEGPLAIVGPVSRNLIEFRISNNMLSGEIPSKFGGFEGLSFLHLDGNLFQGGIPPSFSSLRGIEDLDLSRNNFSGRIPEYMGTFLFLKSLNLSFNDFEGAVPEKGVFNNASIVFLQGNSEICGGVLELNLTKCVDVKPRKSKKLRASHLLKYIIPTCIGVPALVMLFLAMFLYKRRRAKRVSLSDGLMVDKFPQVSYRDLHKATDGFSSTNFCGAGKFSSVYKGLLDMNAATVAVKVLNLDVGGAARSFTAECNALKSTRHRNLVKVLTSCSTVDFQGNDFKALVYAYMENGSLERWLTNNPRSLTLLERLNIVIDVACALDYLHNQTGVSMVHCDIKPSNVLLDSDMVAHLGDFGLLKFLQHAMSGVSSTSHTSSLGIKGTVGYAAPEYGMGSEISTYGDMYSFGILILEIFTGKRPTDEMFCDGLNLHNYVKMAIPDRVLEIPDSMLLLNGEVAAETPENEINAIDDKVREFLISIFRVGVVCSSEVPRERFHVADTSIELQSIKKKFLESTVSA